MSIGMNEKETNDEDTNKGTKIILTPDFSSAVLNSRIW